MKKNTVTQEQIDKLFHDAEKKYDVVFDKCLRLTVQLPNGFILTESSACVDPANFSAEVGRKIVDERIKNKLWELEGYRLQCDIAERKEARDMGFGAALAALKQGLSVARRGWNGKGIYLALQRPDANSKMTLPYIYIVTNGLVTDNPEAPKGVVPWLASQTDMLANDWYVV